MSEPRQSDEIGSAGEEAGERRCERDFARGCQAHRCSDHVLLGDVHLEETIRRYFLEELSMRGVLDISVGTNNGFVYLANLRQSLSRGFAGGDFFAEFVLRSRHMLVRRILPGLPRGLAWHRLWSIGFYELFFQFRNRFFGFVFL